MIKEVNVAAVSGGEEGLRSPKVGLGEANSQVSELECELGSSGSKSSLPLTPPRGLCF